MVYVNTFKSIFFLIIQLILAGFVLLVAFLWVKNLESKSTSDVREELSSHECNCLSIISDNNSEIIIMNVRCNYVSNFSINSKFINNTLYLDDYTRFSYANTTYFVLEYNDCIQYYLK